MLHNEKKNKMPGFCPTGYGYQRRTRAYCKFPSRQSKQGNSLTEISNKYIICRSFMSFWLNELSIIKENYTMSRRTRPIHMYRQFYFFKYVSYNYTKFVKIQHIELYIVLFLRYEFRASYNNNLYQHSIHLECVRMICIYVFVFIVLF